MLTLNNGQKVTTPAQWLERRKEIFEIFDREIYGRVPELAQNLQVTWTVTSTTQGMTGDVATITRQLSGHVDNSFYPLIDVKIDASVTTPANATGRVPVIIVFGGGAPRAGAAVGARGAAGAGGARGAGAAAVAPAGPPAPPVYTIANFTTALSLTDEQAAKVSPVLDAINQDQKNLTAAQSAYTSQRSASIAQINALLNPIQQPMLAQAMTPGAGFAPRGGAARGAMGAGARGAAPGGGGGGANWQQLALAKGWGFGSLNPASIQADNGAGLTTGGIIALVAKGQERKPDEWGSLRAWAWGADRLLDFFATDDKVDGKQVAFEGHSRYGKATMVTLAYDDRAATGFVSSSGEGGAKLWRRLVGEQVENLASTQEYYWMAGNFLKYAGPLTVEDLPIDAHEFIALVAPRPIFTSGGMYVDGGVPYSNELWQDAPGTFMATAGASPVYELLGKKG